YASFTGVYSGNGAQPVTVVNHGSIFGGMGAVALLGGGAITNAADGTIDSRNFGIYLAGQATLLNAGSIMGGRYAVSFGHGYADRVIVEPGAYFGGYVDGGNTIGAT